MVAASSVQVSPLMHRHIILPYPSPTSDVMLTSFTKRAPKSQFLQIFTQNYYFLAFLLVNCKISLHAALRHLHFRSQIQSPELLTTQIHQLSSVLGLTITRYLLFFLCVPWFSELSALKAYQSAKFPSLRLCNCQFNPKFV